MLDFALRKAPIINLELTKRDFDRVVKRSSVVSKVCVYKGFNMFLKNSILVHVSRMRV